MKILFLSACILWCSSIWITCQDLKETTTTLPVEPQSDFVRPGVCPRVSSKKGQDSETECLDSTPQCEADVDCDEEQKCCHNGCSRVCVYPSFTGCQQLRAFLERQEQLSEEKTKVFVPKCKTNGEFENIQCSNVTGKCWCVDSLGFELSGTRANSLDLVNCKAPLPCADVLCRMLCPYGFQLDSEGCPLCKCRNPCEGVECPAGQECQLEEIPCVEDACPPLPTCKQPRTLEGLCPVGTPLSSPDSGSPFLCGVEPNKPQCPPSYLCDVMPGNDYGVCCPLVDKPGKCPSELQTGEQCGHKCGMDMDCGSVDKCCFIEECGQICTKPANTTLCLQQKAVVELLLSNNPGYEGYIPQCLENGEFSPKQCSINGHLCWCVTVNGTIVLGTMGPVDGVQCDEPKQLETFTIPNVPQCEKLSCDKECETGYRYDGKGCRTCECARPCEDIACPEGMECVLMKMDNCLDEYCPPVATCKDLTSNLCSWGKPLVDEDTNEQVKCTDNECPNSHVCEFLQDENGICCPKNIVIESTKPQECPMHIREPDTCDDICDSDTDCDGEMKCCPSKSCGAVCVSPKPPRLPTMCEYLRSEGLDLETADGNITLAIPIPQCQPDGSYNPTQCSNSGECWCVDEFGVEITGTRTSEQQNMDCVKVRDQMSCLGLICRLGCDFGFVMDEAGCPLCSCRNPCQNASCGPESTCQFLEVDCKEDWCPPLPHCIPLEVSARNFPTCPMGSPMMYEHDNQPVICDPFSSYPQCPSTHDCVVSDPRETGVCCPRAARDSELLNKKGQCPYLIPLQSDSCDNECSSDRDCNDDQKCCSNGCGTHCVEPVLKTACQHQRAATEHRARELSIPASRVFLPKCDDSGDFSPVQCHPLTGNCWCVDKNGLEVPGTRAQNERIVSCISESEHCPSLECDLSCISGYQLDNKGCPVCSCYDPCEDVECRNSGESCRLAQVNCITEPCPPIPLCLPRLENPCPIGEPLRDEDYGELFQCGPKSNKCPSSHRCYLSPLEEYAVCCPQPKSTTCEQLKERNLKFRKHNNRVAFIPKCNKKTGAWEPTQCMESLGLCWCVDSDGNQLPGTLIRGVPHCTARSAKNIEYTPICPGGEPVHICPETLCEGKICLAYPNASCHINPCGGCSVEFMDEINHPVNCNEGLTACFAEVQEIINNRISSSQYLIDGDLFPVLEDNIGEISTPPPAYPPPPPPPIMSMSMNRRQILHDYDYDEPQQHQDYNSYDPQYEHFDIQALHTEDHPVMLTPRLEGVRIQMTTRTQPIMEAFEIRPVIEIFHSQPQLEIMGISHQFTLVDRADHSLLVKPGLCPVPSLLSILHNMARGCMDQCMTDMDCPGFSKCCLYSCGLSCVQPDLLPVLQPSPKVGKCPVLPRGGISPIACLLAKRECITDEDCGGIHKCCATACGFECMKAIEQKKEPVLKPATLQASVPRCSAEGGYAIAQQQGELSWCVDQFGNPLHDTLTRGTVECDINGTIIFQQHSGPVCQSPEQVPRVCKEECIKTICVQHPDAICIADPCKDCAVTFVSEEGSPVSCEEKCHQPLVVGNCRSSLPRYYFNQSSNKCEQFMYGGCQGNDNNFETLEICQEECEWQVPQCEQPKEVGLCRAQMLRWFYNKERHQCEQFVYGGCGGNDNNFETKADCERICPDLVLCPWINVKGQSLIPCSKSMVCSNATCNGRLDAVCTVDSCSCEPVFFDKQGLPIDCLSSISENIGSLRTAPIAKYTRCESLLKRHLSEGDSGYLPQCDENGQFFPVQCTQQKEPEAQCWCVDEAGMQLPSTSLFSKGSKTCKFVKVKKVEVTLAFKHDDPLYSEVMILDIKRLLQQFLNDISADANEVAIKVLPDATHVMFTLENDNKVQVAFQLEEMVRMQGMSIILPKAEMVADYRASHFYHILDYEVDPDDVDNSVAANHISSVEFKEREGSWPLFLVVVMAGIILFLGIIILVAITVRRRRQQDDDEKPKSSLVSMVFNNITYGVMGKKPVEKNLDAVPQVTVQTVEAQYESLQKKSDDQMSEVSEAPPAYDDVDEKEKSEKPEKH